MSADTIRTIVEAALEAAKVIAKITPSELDDKIAAIAEVIVAEVFGLFNSCDDCPLSDDALAAAKEAGSKIKVSLSV